VHKTYGAKTALENADLHIRKGEFVFISGPSGAGKTTLLRIMFGDEEPTSGHVLVNGINLKRISSRKLAHLRRSVGFVFQDFKLLTRKTVFENVALALEVTGAPRDFIRRRTRQTLKLVGLKQNESDFPLQLSGGEQQRVAIARAVVKEPLLLLADEPTGNLDPDLTQDIMVLFRSIHLRGTTVVVATHSRELLDDTAQRIILLDKGMIAGEHCP
jgi:cell division transport system ATP-binding protein